MDDTPPAEELQNKLQVLEEGNKHRKQELSTLFIKDYSYANLENQKALSVLPQCPRFSTKTRISSQLPSTPNFTNRQYLNILQSMGQAVYIFDRNCHITYWNRAAGSIFGYSLAEAIGHNAVELLADPQAFVAGQSIAQRLTNGESWTGKFPVKNKKGDMFSTISTSTPFYNDDGTFVGVLCVSSDVQPFREERVQLLGVDDLPEPDSSLVNCGTVTTQLGFNPQQPLQNAVTSRLTTLASKVSKSRFSAGKDNWDCKTGKGDSPQCDHIVRMGT